MSSSYPPELYAKLHVGNPGDLAFYRDRCADADSVLELGCGYGRVLQALAQPGRTLIGLDRDRGLLGLASQRLTAAGVPARALVQGDMRCFAFARSFERILIPYSGIYCLPSDADVVSCLRCVRDHLTAKGLLIFDAYAADAFHRDGVEGGDPEQLEQVEPEDEVGWIEHAGTHYLVSEQGAWSREDQHLEVVYVHEPRSGGHSIAARIDHHYLLSEQIAPLLDAAGLELTSLAGDFRGSTLDDDSEFLIVCAQRR